MNAINKDREQGYVETARRLGISGDRVEQRAARQRTNKQSKVATSPMVAKIAARADTMLTARQVAELLHVHINTVRRWSNQDILKSFRLGTRCDRRFIRQDIEDFLRSYPPTQNSHQNYR